MKVMMRKVAAGILVPETDLEAEKMIRFKSSEIYEVDIKNQRNPDFHRKVFLFMSFCFNYWSDNNEFATESRSFDVFREHLTCLAGYYNSYVGINGEVRIVAESLSYANMDQEKFEELYKSLINVAMTKIFAGCDECSVISYNGQEVNIYEKLVSFF